MSRLWHRERVALAEEVYTVRPIIVASNALTAVASGRFVSV